MSLRPAYLTPGSRVHLLSTARWVTEEMVSAAVAVIEENGLHAILSKEIYARHYQLAGTDAQRAAALQDAIDSTEGEAILCLRGGYGSQRMMDLVDWTTFVRSPKWLMGFSDVTALHSHVNNHLGICSLHCAMPSTYGSSTPRAIQESVASVMGPAPDLHFDTDTLSIEGRCRGRLLGGNLTMLHTLMGTPSAPLLSNAVLYFEEIDEMIYHLDRMLLHMYRAGVFEGVAGIVVGGLSSMRDNTIAHGFSSDSPFGAGPEEVVRERLGGLGVPLAFGLPAGHISDNRPLVLGAEVELSVSASTSILKYI